MDLFEILLTLSDWTRPLQQPFESLPPYVVVFHDKQGELRKIFFNQKSTVNAKMDNKERFWKRSKVNESIIIQACKVWCRYRLYFRFHAWLNFWMGISILNFIFCFHGIPKSVHRFSFRSYTMHIQVMIFTGEEFNVDPFRDLESVRAKIWNNLLAHFFMI